MKRRQVPDWLLNKTIAHRGLHDNIYLENTLGAFKQAINKGYVIELDIHLTADGKLAVFHDNDLSRLVGVDKNIEECTMDELKTYNIKGSSEKIPTLEEVLELVNGKTELLIEIKNEGQVGQLESMLNNTLKNYKHGNYAVQSFNPLSMKWFKDNAPEVIRGQLSGAFEDKEMPSWKKFLLKNCLTNNLSEPDFIHYDIKKMPNLVTKIAKFIGIPVLGWTARTKKERDTAKKYCDNMVMEGEAIREQKTAVFYQQSSM